GEKAGFTPQHEKVDGSYINTGENNPLPVTDTELKSELESIKQTQAQILERLDSPIDTQLKGSVVELSRKLNRNITAGGRSTILSVDPAEHIDYKEFFIITRNDSKHNFRVDIDWKVPSTSFGTIYGETAVFEGDLIWGASPPIRMKASGLRLIVLNRDIEEHQYDFYVYGVK